MKLSIDVIKHRWAYLGISIAALLPGLVFLVLSMVSYPNHAPLRLGIDFTGGAMLEYSQAPTKQAAMQQKDLTLVRQVFAQLGHPEAQAQLSVPEQAAQTKQAVILSVRTKALQKGETAALLKALQQRFKGLAMRQQNTIGPSLAKEILSNGLMALLLGYLLIVGYLTLRFQWDYAMAAMAALVHDTVFVMGTFSLLGWLWHVEVDSLFITAILTVVGFSVHDTIVVFDRIRENTRLLHSKKLPFAELVNISVNQTLARSINTSLTALLSLIALYCFGGESIQQFVFTMILGIIAGTYSSICNASVLLAMWREKQGREKRA